MSEKTTEENENQESEAPERVAIEGMLPLTTIDIESQKDMKSGRYHPLRSLHKWFAARPTPAVRLAVIGSVYPGEITSDELLRYMKVGPKALDEGIEDYVESKFVENRGNKNIDEHYGYPNPNSVSPTDKELENLHETVKHGWGGELPTILDPTAGRGIIPFESLRYGFPTKANELNPVATLIMKTGIELATSVGPIESEVRKWRDKINHRAKEKLERYYPTKEPDREVLTSAGTYLITCSSCGGDIPLASKWWLNKTSSGGDAIKPVYNNGSVEYNHIKVEDTSEDYDPTDAPVTRGDAECPYCGVVTQEKEIRSEIHKGNYEYSIYGVNYETAEGEQYYRAGSDIDKHGMEKAAERIESDFGMIDFLSEQVESGLNTSQIKRYGMNQWSDIYTPRQLVTQYEYLQSYKEFAPEIRKFYSEEESETILTILTLSISRTVQFNSRLTKWLDSRGYGGDMFADNNLALKKMFVDSNLTVDTRGYVHHSDHIIDSYEELASYATGMESAELTSGDASNLTEHWDCGDIDVAVVDPPYYTSIMYAELSDVFYTIQKRYLHDVYPDIFSSELANKQDEAVANPSRFEAVKGNEQSEKELSRRHYREKMTEIFSEIHELLSSNGVMTLMFTHREMEAWDTLITALIESGFTVTATHPIKTEKTDRIGVQDKASADSSILLVGRKRKLNEDDSRTLWEDVQDEFYTVAENKAEEIIESGFTISKTDTAIATYGPTLQKFSKKFPVVTKKGEEIKPREALSEAQKAVTSVLTERFLDTEGVDQLDSLTRWYILSWLIYENNVIPYDEANQLGVAAGIDIDDIKRPTKLWRGGKKVTLQQHSDRVQDIVMLRNDSVDDPSSRKYPVDPTSSRFTYTIDCVHAALHVYERDGPESAWDWITERNLKSDEAFAVAVTALLEVLPADEEMYETLVDLISGQTGEYLDINVDHIDMSGVDRQSSLGDHAE